MLGRRLVLLVLVVSLAGCTDSETEKLARQNQLVVQSQKLSSILGDATARVTGSQQSLTIQLTFGADADLDLYVTDPLLETVYFANHSGRSGGRISDDIRCDTAVDVGSDIEPVIEPVFEGKKLKKPRIEEVRFDNPMPGRYRIGIDYPIKCEGGAEQAAFAVSVLHNGEQIQKSGAVSFERFEVVVMEFEI